MIKVETFCTARAAQVANSKLALLVDPYTGGRGRELLDEITRGVVDSCTPVPEANEVLGRLEAEGVPAAVATNDDEVASLKQLDRLGWSTQFQTVLACDSGFGAKPAGGMLLEAARRLGVEPQRCAMVGDAASDLEAAKAAGYGAAILVGPPEVVGHHAKLADYWVHDLSGLLRPSKNAVV